MIQVTFFLLWAVLESVNLIRKGKSIPGGVLLGIAINIKLMPILLLPYLVYRGYFKALLVCVITCIALLFLPALFIGYDDNQFLLSEWWSIINPGNKEHLFETGIGTHSLTAFLPVYLTETGGEMPFKRNIFNLNYEAVTLIVNISRLFLLSLSLLYFRSLPFRQESNKLKSFWELAFFLLLIPLILPHQQKYAFLLAVPMVSYLVYFFIATHRYPRNAGYYLTLSIFILCALFFSPLYGSDIIGKFLFRLTQHYRFLTFATLFLIPVSLYCNPGKLSPAPEKPAG
jgi:hypothetical protein